MRVNAGETIAGIPILRVRNVLKRLRELEWTVSALAVDLKVSTAVARRVAPELEKLGYIERVGKRAGHVRWRVSRGAAGFVNATAARPISRKTAERLLGEFMARVKEVNANPYYLFRVARVVAFGSYLTRAETLGDIDLGVTLEPKEPDHDHHLAHCKIHISKALDGGRRFPTFLDELAWPEREVWLFLRARSRYINIHSDDDAVLSQTETRLLYGK